MCAETTLGKFAISLVLVISCEPVNVETESKNFSALKRSMFTDGNKTIISVPVFLPTCIGTLTFLLMGDKTVHEDSNNMTPFKYKYKLS